MSIQYLTQMSPLNMAFWTRSAIRFTERLPSSSWAIESSTTCSYWYKSTTSFLFQRTKKYQFFMFAFSSVMSEHKFKRRMYQTNGHAIVKTISGWKIKQRLSTQTDLTLQCSPTHPTDTSTIGDVNWVFKRHIPVPAHPIDDLPRCYPGTVWLQQLVSDLTVVADWKFQNRIFIKWSQFLFENVW